MTVPVVQTNPDEARKAVLRSGEQYKTAGGSTSAKFVMSALALTPLLGLGTVTLCPRISATAVVAGLAVARVPGVMRHKPTDGVQLPPAGGQALQLPRIRSSRAHSCTAWVMVAGVSRSTGL